MRSSSNYFEKDVNSTQAFDYDQLADSNFDFAQSVQQFDLEQSCLMRLKAQRQKIEQLTKLYQQNEKELAKSWQKEKQMSEEIERLTEMAAYKSEWEELNKDYQALAKKFQLTEVELVGLKKQLQGVAVSSCDEADQLKKEIKYLKEQRILSDAHWEAIIADKDELLKKQMRGGQQKVHELCDKIQKLEEKIECLEEALSEKTEELQARKEEFKMELTARDQDLAGFEKVVQSFKKQNGEYKQKIISLQDAFERQKCQYLEVLDQLKMQVKLLRKEQSQKQNQIYEFKQMIKKCDTKNQALESTVNSLKSNLKKFKANTDTSFKKMTSSTEDEKAKLQLFIHELKSELEKQMEEKGSLVHELKRLKGHIERKEQQQKQRKLLLMTEFRQIDKMQKMVKKIL